MHKEELKEEYNEIKNIVANIQEVAEGTNNTEIALDILEKYRIIGEILRQLFLEELIGTSWTREFILHGSRMRIGVYYDPKIK